MRIGVLQTGHINEHLADRYPPYPQMFQSMLRQSDPSLIVEPYAVVDGVFPDSERACEGWMITGSRHGAYEDHDWIPPLENLIRKIVGQSRPIIGICFGHQIMAQALGGTVIKSPKGWGLGRQQYDWWGDGQRRPLDLFALHQDQVVELPDGAEIIAQNDFCPAAALRFAPHAVSVQPHPEFSEEFVADLLTVLKSTGRIDTNLVDDGLSTLGPPVHADEIGHFFTNFLGAHKRAAAACLA